MDSGSEYRSGRLWIFLQYRMTVHTDAGRCTVVDCLRVICLLRRDTAGQERYQTITKQYYRRAQV